MKNQCPLCPTRCKNAEKWVKHVFYCHVAYYAPHPYGGRLPQFRGACWCGHGAPIHGQHNGRYSRSYDLEFFTHCLDRLTAEQRAGITDKPQLSWCDWEEAQAAMLLHLHEYFMGGGEA